VKSFCIFLLVLAPIAIAAQSKPAATTMKVRIEAQETSKRPLLERLQADGKDLGLVWQESATGFDYRILFQIRDETNMRVFWCVTSAAVYAADGKELFQFTQGAWSCTQATDSSARMINEKLIRLKPDPQRRR
jgi:hypothetical protein